MAVALLHDDRRNLAGMLTNDGQQISRVEALRLYTEGAAWFSFDDHQVGSFVEANTRTSRSSVTTT